MDHRLSFEGIDVLYRFVPSNRFSPCDEYVFTGSPLTLWGRYGDDWQDIGKVY